MLGKYTSLLGQSQLLRVQVFFEIQNDFLLGDYLAKGAGLQSSICCQILNCLLLVCEFPQNHFFGARKGARKMGGTTPFSPPIFLGPKPGVWGDIWAPKRGPEKWGETPPSLPPFFWALSRGFGGTFGPQKLSFKGVRRQG